MQVRLWGAWVVHKVYWHRIAIVATVAFAGGYLTSELLESQRADAAQAKHAATQAAFDELNHNGRVLGLSYVQADVGPVVVSSHSGVFLSTNDGESHPLYSGRAYDTLVLPGGGMFVCERYRNKVVRLDPSGEKLYELDAQGPVDCELAPDGTLVVVQNGSKEIVGMDSKSGDVRWRLGGFSNHYDVSLTPDGGMFVADSGNGRVVRYDADRNLVSEHTGLGFPNTVEALPNGNVLVTTYHDGEVFEFEGLTGEIVSRHKIDGTVFRAVQTQDGLTLVFEGERSDGRSLLHVYNADGILMQSRPTARGTDFDLVR